MRFALCSSFGCSAVTRCYDRTDDNANAPINHATERSRMQRVVRNLLLDPMCEENSSVWEKSSTGTITRDQSTRQFGLVSYHLTIWSSDCVYVRQAVTLMPGKSYTLSGYVRSSGPRGVMRVTYTVGNESFSLDSEPGKVWKKTDNMPYERVSVSFTLPENAEPKVYCMAYCDMQNGFAGGNCWFDAMQLEEGLTLNHFNMVQNSDFSAVGTDGKPKAWTVGNNSNSYVSVLPLENENDIFHAPDCLKHDNTQKIHLLGRYDRTVTYYQQFRHYGKIGDRFTVGGWCSSFAKKNDPDNSVYCRITVQFTSADPVTDKSYWATGGSAVFNAEEGNWQFASAGIVAPNNCTYIRVVLQMNRQMNFADFTGIYLYPEAFGTQYIYDKNGNRKTRKMLYGGQEKSEFDDADNLTKHTAAGRTVSSTFHYGDTEEEQKKHLLLKSIAPLGSVSKFSYDNFGNPLTSQVQNADANPSYFIRGETTYTDDGNYVTEQKDARGKIVRTETDPQRGTTTSVTDAKGQTVEYKYDELRRIVKTSAKMGAKEGSPTIHNEYTYDEQRGNLVEIRHNTDGNAANDVVYSFEQDALGRQTAVKVGNQTLSQSVYQNDPTKPNLGTLTATTYGNGAKICSRYDDFNRVTGVVYGEETAPRYEYDYNAKGQVARVRDNLLNRSQNITFGFDVHRIECLCKGCCNMSDNGIIADNPLRHSAMAVGTEILQDVSDMDRQLLPLGLAWCPAASAATPSPAGDGAVTTLRHRQPDPYGELLFDVGECRVVWLQDTAFRGSDESDDLVTFGGLRELLHHDVAGAAVSVSALEQDSENVLNFGDLLG